MSHVAMALLGPTYGRVEKADAMLWTTAFEKPWLTSHANRFTRQTGLRPSHARRKDRADANLPTDIEALMRMQETHGH